MATLRKPTHATADSIDQFCAPFDDLFNRRAARQAFRHYLIGIIGIHRNAGLVAAAVGR